MVTTKYNFKLWLHRKYPDITAIPVYGIPAYILSKDLDPMDSHIYNVQQLADGRYIVFIGITNTRPISEWIQKLNTGKPIKVRENIAPTTFTAFEQWLVRNSIVPLHRTFCSHKSASQVLMTQAINNCINTEEPKTWYLYELPYNADETPVNMYSRVPNVVTENGTIAILIKACNSKYVSKKQRFAEKFVQMQPLYEQLIKTCATAATKDALNQPSEDDWNKAVTICEQYMGIQFEYTGTVELKDMKEAANGNMLGFFTRDRSNLKPISTDADF